jgi:hypothetical protein
MAGWKQIGPSSINCYARNSMEKRINYLTNNLKRFLEIEPVKLRREFLNNIPGDWGIYRILFPNSEKTLYIGISGRLKKRIWNDLLGSSGHHTLKTKLYKYKKIQREKTINYLNKCCIQLMGGKEKFVVALEHFAIAVLDPDWND